MKAYGKDRRSYASRKLRGTSMPCPCCIPSGTHRRSQTKAYQKRARQAAQQECRSGYESEG